MSSWRKVASAIWSRPTNPQIFGDIEVDARGLLAYVEHLRSTTETHVTVTHVAGKAVARAFADHPELNVVLSRGKFVQRDSVDVFFVVAVDEGRDLSGVKIKHADSKSVVEIAEELRSRAARIRSGEDSDFSRAKSMVDATPAPLLRLGLRLADWLTNDIHVDLRRFGFRREAFGSAMVSSVGMFGVQRAYGPLSPYHRIPVFVLVSEVAVKPVVDGDEIVARPILTISATIDHRYLDGAHAASLARAMRGYLEDPASHEAVPERRPTARAEP